MTLTQGQEFDVVEGPRFRPSSPVDWQTTDQPPIEEGDFGPLPTQLIKRYVEAAMRRLVTKRLDDATWSAMVPDLRGVLAWGATEDEVTTELRSVIADWVTLKIEDHDRDLPVLDLIDLNSL